MPDAITLLSPHGLIATKSVYPDRSEPAPPAKMHRALVASLDGFDSFVNALRTLVDQPTWYAVRGEPKAELDLGNMRRSHVEPGATLVERARRWVLLDLDKVMLEVKAADFAADPRRYAIAARNLLPPCFRTVACWFQATGSAGVKPGVRLRLGFWLDRAVSSSEWRQWTESWDVEIDKSLFTASQPHYTAKPVFLEGAIDPVQGERCGVLEGATNEVTVPVMVSDRAEIDNAQVALRAALKRLNVTPEGERNTALNRTAFALGRRFHEDDLPADKIVSTLSGAVWLDTIPDHHSLDTLQRAVRDGRAKRDQERDGWRGLLAHDPKTDATKACAANVSIFIEHHPAFAGRLAMEQGAAVWVVPPPWREEPGPHTAADTTFCVEWFSHQAKLDVKPAWVDAGVHKAAGLRPINALEGWLGALPRWDGAGRAETLFVRYLGAEDTPYVRAATRVWLLQARGRAGATMEAPYKADHTIVLHGAQGIGKSTVLSALVPTPRYFLDHLPDLRDKDARLALSRAWIVELAELTQKTADKDVFKAFLTSTIDSVRRPYGREVVDVPRRCVFAASTNDSEFLNDPTGARRFLPIACHGTALPVEAIGAMVAKERDQLWAEVMTWPADELPILPAFARAEAEARREEVRARGSAEEALREALARPLGAFVGVDFGRDDLSSSRHVVRVKVTQAAALIQWPTHNKGLHAIKDALRCMGWVEKRNTPGIGRHFVPPSTWVYEQPEGLSAARPN